MRIAIIDIGTNSARLDVREFSSRDRGTTLLHRQKNVLRLGREIYRTGGIDPSGFERLVATLEEFVRVSKEKQAERIEAVGTSALRDAKNSLDILAELKRRFPFHVRVISGEEEARLIARGVLACEAIEGDFALIDIGGGSTEITVGRGSTVRHSESLQLGALRIQEQYLKASPPTEANLETARSAVREILARRKPLFGTPSSIIGTSGTIKAIARLELSPKGAVRRGDLQTFIRKIAGMTPDELRAVRLMEESRVDIILAGSLLLEELLIAFEADEIRVSEFSLRDGIAEELLDELRA